jgi:putative nucleotidyltransferase with HDIG domain
MERVTSILKQEKIAEILNEVSRHFHLPFVILDMQGEPFFSALGESGTTSFSAEVQISPPTGAGKYPLCYNGETIGTIAAPSSVEYLEAIAFCIENSLRLETENLDLSAEVVRIYEEQALIYSLSRKLGNEMEVESICRYILDEAGKVLAANNISVMLLDPVTNELYTGQCKGRDREAAVRFRTDAASGLLGRIFQNGEPITLSDVGSEERLAFPYPVRSILCVPLVTDDKGIGMLVASDKLTGEEFWSQELKLMRVFALEAAASIRKAQLYEVIRALYIHTVEALASAIDAKDPYTFGHSNRVARFSMVICEELGMSRKEVRQVELAAILHDIGKIGTPESILQKPGKLTPEEILIIREHPVKGALILSNISELRDVITWIRHHHEWYDGNGYPDRIAGDEIPLQARVIAVADCFDAMTSDRPYRKGMTADVAIGKMEECSGSQFDPHILRVFKTGCEGGRLSFYLNRQEKTPPPFTAPASKAS